MSDTRPPILIPGNLKGSVPRHIVAKTDYIYDDPWDKTQREINEEFDQRITDIQELAEISIEGGDIQIATSADFIEPISAESRAKIPTVGAIVDGYILAETGNANRPVFINRNHKPEEVTGIDVPENIHSDKNIEANWGVAAGGIATLDVSATGGSVNEIELGEGGERLQSHSGLITFPLAATNQIGAVELSSTPSTVEDKAATPKLVYDSTSALSQEITVLEGDIEIFKETVEGEIETFSSELADKVSVDEKGNHHLPIYIVQVTETVNGETVTRYVTKKIDSLTVYGNIESTEGGVAAKGIADLSLSGGTGGGGGGITEIDIDGTPLPVEHGVVDLPAYPTWSDIKPNNGIPSTDLSQDVQEALDKADDAVQESNVISYSNLDNESSEDLTHVPSAFGVRILKGQINIEGLPNFTPSHSYERGDLCKIQDGIGVLRGYRCVETHTSGDTWDGNESGYWERLTYETLANPLNITEEDLLGMLVMN